MPRFPFRFTSSWLSALRSVFDSLDIVERGYLTQKEIVQWSILVNGSPLTDASLSFVSGFSLSGELWTFEGNGWKWALCEFLIFSMQISARYTVGLRGKTWEVFSQMHCKWAFSPVLRIRSGASGHVVSRELNITRSRVYCR